MSLTQEMIEIAREDAVSLAKAALEACGASPAQSASLADAAVSADEHGHHGQGLDHLDPYCDGLLKGRINGQAEPICDEVTPVLFSCDALEGTAHLAFDRSADRLIKAARTFGIAAYSGRNSFPCGELGYFVRRLMDQGLGGLAATNAGPALLAASGSKKAVFCTNPLAFGVPAEGRQLLIDQSSSATAFTNLRIAARDPDAKIPDDWALDRDGEPTNDPKKAIEGVLLAYGGGRGANMALMVELLAAGLSGANWSVDAPPFHQGGACPGGGLFVLAFDPVKFGGEANSRRLGRYLARLESEFGVYLPGKRKFDAKCRSDQNGVRVAASVISKLKSLAQNR